MRHERRGGLCRNQAAGYTEKQFLHDRSTQGVLRTAGFAWRFGGGVGGRGGGLEGGVRDGADRGMRRGKVVGEWLGWRSAVGYKTISGSVQATRRSSL